MHLQDILGSVNPTPSTAKMAEIPTPEEAFSVVLAGLRPAKQVGDVKVDSPTDAAEGDADETEILTESDIVLAETDPHTPQDAGEPALDDISADEAHADQDWFFDLGVDHFDFADASPKTDSDGPALPLMDGDDTPKQPASVAEPEISARPETDLAVDAPPDSLSRSDLASPLIFTSDPARRGPDPSATPPGRPVQAALVFPTDPLSQTRLSSQNLAQQGEMPKVRSTDQVGLPSVAGPIAAVPVRSIPRDTATPSRIPPNPPILQAQPLGSQVTVTSGQAIQTPRPEAELAERIGPSKSDQQEMRLQGSSTGMSSGLEHSKSGMHITRDVQSLPLFAMAHAAGRSAETGDRSVPDTGLNSAGATSASQTFAARVQAPTHAPPVPAAIIQQLAEAARHLPDRPVEIRLSPEELGRVRMTLSVSETGMSVSISAERDETLNLLRRNADLLSTALGGLDLGTLDIGFHRDQSDAQSDSEQATDDDGTGALILSPDRDNPPSQVVQSAQRLAGADRLDIRI